MEKVLGIIAEYNPFHNGHLYHLSESKKITGSKYSIAVISGNFTQRGSTSLVNKWVKTKMALQSGIDLVIELPLLYSISSAENFAYGAINILNSLNIVDYLSFGAEAKNIQILKDISNILYSEPEEFKSILSTELDKGLSFPKARQIALLNYIKSNNSYISSDDLNNYTSVINSPNNILGIEYLKALKRLNSAIDPILINRFQSNYNDTSFTGNIASATSIRDTFKSNNINQLSCVIPNNNLNLLLEELEKGHLVLDLSAFQKQILYNLRTMSINDLSNIAEVSEGLEFKLKKAALTSSSLDDLINSIKSKRYTLTRIQRMLLYVLLNVTKEDINISKKAQPYIRVLGFNENGRNLISKISKSNPNLEIITSVKSYMDISKNTTTKFMLEKDILATNIYTLAYSNDSFGNLDYTHNIIK